MLTELELNRVTHGRRDKVQQKKGLNKNSGHEKSAYF